MIHINSEGIPEQNTFYICHTLEPAGTPQHKAMQAMAGMQAAVGLNTTTIFIFIEKHLETEQTTIWISTPNQPHKTETVIGELKQDQTEGMLNETIHALKETAINTSASHNLKYDTIFKVDMEPKMEFKEIGTIGS